MIAARLATGLHPIGATLLAVFGSVVAIPFVLLHGAGNGMLTIARGTLLLALFGPTGYGLRTGVLSAPAYPARWRATDVRYGTRSGRPALCFTAVRHAHQSVFSGAYVFAIDKIHDNVNCQSRQSHQRPALNQPACANARRDPTSSGSLLSLRKERQLNGKQRARTNHWTSLISDCIRRRKLRCSARTQRCFSAKRKLAIPSGSALRCAR